MHWNRLVKMTPALLAGLILTTPVVAEKADLGAATQVRPQAIDNEPMLAQALAAFDVSVGSLTTLDVPKQVGIPFDFVAPIDGQEVIVSVWPHSVRAAGYQLLVDDGTRLVPAEPGPINTFRGSVDGMPDARVVGGMEEEGMRLRITMADQTTRWIEPLTGKVPGARDGDYIVYRGEDVFGLTGTCGVSEDAIPLDPGDAGIGDRGAGCDGGTCVAQIGCDADFEFYQGRGSSVTNVENRINLVIATVNDQYEPQVGIVHEITAIIVRTQAGAPYTSTNSNTLLTQFRNEWNNNQGGIQRDVAELFSGKDFDGTTIGLASVGVICTTSAYNIVESDCCGSLSCAADLSAHELGHNWSALHCAGGCNNTMNSGLVCANNFNATSINSITNHRDSRGCLSPLETGMTTLPFFDPVPVQAIDTALWIGNEGTTADFRGINEPSEMYSYRFNGTDTLRSALMDASGATNITLSYYWQRTGGGNSPEPGDDLFVEYLTNTGAWSTVAVHLGDGPDQTEFNFESFVLPGNAGHSGLRIRFRHTADQNFFDDFFVDDISVVAAQDPPAAFNLLAPTDGETDVDLGPFFDWEDAGGAANYRLQVDDDADFSSPALNIVVLGSQANIGGNPLDNATLYYWKVIAMNANGDTDSNAVFTFSTPGYVPPVGCDGDADGDNDVDFDDLNAVLGNWATAGPSGDVFPAGGGDGQVNFDDLNFVLGNWGTTCP